MGYEGWTDWQTWYCHLMMGNERRANNLVHQIVRRALWAEPGEQVYKVVAETFARRFRYIRDSAKAEFDENLQDTMAERGEFEARQIEGKNPPPSEYGRVGDILNQAMDLIRSGMGSGALPKWKEPNWLEIAEWEVEEEKTQRRSGEAAARMRGTVPGENVELPEDMKEGLKGMGIQGAKETKMSVKTKVVYTLKGSKQASILPSPEVAKRFVRATAAKWGKDFDPEPITSGISDIGGSKPEGLKSAAGDAFHGKWFLLSTAGGKLDIMATPEGQTEAKALMDKPTDYALVEFLEEATANGWDWKTPEELGALTSAPIIASPAGNVYWHERYQVDDPIEILASGKVLSFDFAGNLRKNDFHGEDAVATTPGGEVMASVKEKTSGFNFFFPGQALREFYPEIQHELVSYPNATNAPMAEAGIDNPKATNEQMVGGIVGDPHESPELDLAIEASFDNMTKLGYISTSPAGAAGLGRDFKPQTLEGTPFRKENEIRGGMFDEEYHAQYGDGPALGVVAKQAALGREKEQFGSFLKKVMAEVAATFVAAYKVTSRPPLNKIPGTGELSLDQVEQQQMGMSSFNLVDSGSRVKHLVERMNDSDIQDCINDAWAQAAVWCSDPAGGFVYEVFVRAETLDSESLKLKYKFVTGSRDSGI